MLSPERRDVPQQPIRDPARKCSITRSSYAVFQMLMHEISRLEYAQGFVSKSATLVNTHWFTNRPARDPRIDTRSSSRCRASRRCPSPHGSSSCTSSPLKLEFSRRALGVARPVAPALERRPVPPSCARGSARARTGQLRRRCERTECRSRWSCRCSPARF